MAEKRPSRPGPWREAAVVLGVVAVYFAAARLGLSMAFDAPQVSAVWPPTGIALAALLLLGRRAWPGVLLGAFLANVTASEPILAAAGIAVGNTLEAVVGAWLLRGLVGFGIALDRLRDVLALVGLAALGSTTISATVGTTTLVLAGLQPRGSFGDIWWTWWIGDAIGDLVVAPVLLTWAAWLQRPSWPRRGEALALFVLVIAGTELAFTAPFGPTPSAAILAYVVFPFVVWGALRLGPPATATVAVLASAVAIWGTVHRAGPFAGGDPGDNVLLLQLFMGVVALTGLLLAAAVAERSRAEAGARLSEDRLRMALDAASLGIWDYEVATGRVNWSASLEAIHGLAPGSFKGSFDAYLEDVHPADRERVTRTIAGSIASGQTHDIEYRIVWPDGRVRWVHGRGRVIRDAAGRTLGLAGLCMDVTDRKLADTASRRLAAIVESSGDAVISETLDGSIETWNKAAQRLFGYTAEEAVGRPVSILIPPDHADEEPRILDRVRRGEGVEHYETVRVGKDGRPVPISLTVSPVLDSSGTVVGASKIARDVTERRRVEEALRSAHEALRNANRAKDEFLAMLGHELRNPLAAIANAVSLLNRLGGSDNRTAAARDIIARQTRKLARLVDDLLDVSRLESGKIVVQRERVDLHALAEQCLLALRRSGRVADRTLRLTGEPGVVDADPMRLEQVLINLLENAVKYTPPDGQITVSVARAGEEAVLAVRDTGLGIAPDMLSRIFEPFTQSEQPLDRASGGLGLGLALVRRLVELHGGTVSVTSPGPGRGSEFVVRLPVARGPARESPRPARSPAATAATWRILVVEDNADSREALRLLLEMHGHRVEVAEDGRAGLARLLDSRPEIAFVDLGLPGLDGYALARAVRAAPGGRAVRLVALTGYGQPEDRRRAMEAGFDAHLVKPVEEDRLMELLDARAAS